MRVAGVEERHPTTLVNEVKYAAKASLFKIDKIHQILGGGSITVPDSWFPKYQPEPAIKPVVEANSQNFGAKRQDEMPRNH